MSLQRSYTERVRGEARKKWLQQIIKAAETSGARMEPVYKTLFQTLYKVKCGCIGTFNCFLLSCHSVTGA